MAKKKLAKKTTGSAMSATDAQAMLEALIAEREAVVGDGSLQVVIAIASVTTLVTVDTTQDPPVVTPETLGALRFNDPQIGMSNAQVGIFKANLKLLLPQISADIDLIPDNANLQIAQVVKLVRLSLLQV
jgi:hypothetical protein